MQLGKFAGTVRLKYVGTRVLIDVLSSYTSDLEKLILTLKNSLNFQGFFN